MFFYIYMYFYYILTTRFDILQNKRHPHRGCLEKVSLRKSQNRLIISWRTGERGELLSGRTSYVPSFWDRGSGNQPSSEWGAGSRNRTAAVRGQRRDG